MITINNCVQSRLSGKFLEKVAKIVLKSENKKMRDVSVALVGEREIAALNKKYRKKNKATDVLSFDYSGGASRRNKLAYSGFAGISSAYYEDSGEVVICIPEIRKNAKTFKTSFKKEVARILIHAILHLSGYDHEKSKKEAEKMEEKEILYFKLVNKYAKT